MIHVTCSIRASGKELKFGLKVWVGSFLFEKFLDCPDVVVAPFHRGIR